VGDKYHVLYVSDAQPGVNHSLAQSYAQIETAVRQEKGLTRQAVLESLVRAANIQINWDPLRYLSAEYLALRQTRVVVDGQPLVLPRPAYMIGGRLLVPVKPLAQALGARLSWLAQSSTLSVERGGNKLTLVVGKPVQLVNGQAVMVVAPRLEAGTLMVEARPFLEGLGAKMDYEPAVNTLYVRSGK
jgi:hypothetical protein